MGKLGELVRKHARMPARPAPKPDSTVTTGNSTAAMLATHPLFPAMAALWFAALLGLGTLVLPASLLERLISPLASPPIGFGTRMLLVLIAAGGGAVVGFWLARKLVVPDASSGDGKADAKRHPASADHARPTYKRPLFAKEELGDAPDAAFVPQQKDSTQPAGQAANKRRPLIVSEDTVEETDPFAIHHYGVPLPGEDEQEPSSGVSSSPDMMPAMPLDVPPSYDEEAAQPARDDDAYASADDAEWSASTHSAPLAPSATAPMTPAPTPLRNEILQADLADLGIVALVERLRLALDALASSDEEAQISPKADDGLPATAIAAGFANTMAAPDGGLHNFFADRTQPEPAPEPMAEMDAAVMSGIESSARKKKTMAIEPVYGSADETERALRDALKALRQISGAA